jgi:16S rRNA processing protein RimM
MTEDLIALGVIRKPHGVRGEASVEAWTDSLDRIGEIRSLTLLSPDRASSRLVTIESVRLHAGRALVKFSGIDSPEDVALLRDWTLEIPAAEARPLGPDEYFLHDLVGLTLVDEEGVARGVVTSVSEGGGGILLEVTRGDRRFDVPFAAAICRTVDVPGKRIVVALPAGLDEL